MAAGASQRGNGLNEKGVNGAVHLPFISARH
jgi:hypothetical protein